MRFKTGWHSIVVVIVRQPRKYRAKKKSGRLVKTDFQGRFTAKALRMYAIEFKNESKDSLILSVQGLWRSCGDGSLLSTASKWRREDMFGSRNEKRGFARNAECHRQSNGICFRVANAWQVLGNFCSRGEEKKIAAMDFSFSVEIRTDSF